MLVEVLFRCSDMDAVVSFYMGRSQSRMTFDNSTYSENNLENAKYGQLVLKSLTVFIIYLYQHQSPLQYLYSKLESQSSIHKELFTKSSTAALSEKSSSHSIDTSSSSNSFMALHSSIMNMHPLTPSFQQLRLKVGETNRSIRSHMSDEIRL